MRAASFPEGISGPEGLPPAMVLNKRREVTAIIPGKWGGPGF